MYFIIGNTKNWKSAYKGGNGVVALRGAVVYRNRETAELLLYNMPAEKQTASTVFALNGTPEQVKRIRKHLATTEDMVAIGAVVDGRVVPIKEYLGQ